MSDTLQEQMLAGELDDSDSEMFVQDSGVVTCPLCGSDNDSGTKACWNCGSDLILPSLAERGKRLPIGVLNESPDKEPSFDKRFDVIPLSWNIEKAIGRTWTKARNGLTVSEYLGSILAFTVTKVGDCDMAKLKVDERMNKLNSLFVADVFYMYAYLRLISMGKELTLNNIQCLGCDHRFNFIADVSSMGISVLDDPKKFELEVKLQDGFDLLGHHRDTLVLRPQTWDSLNISGGSSVSDVLEMSIVNSVVEVKGIPRSPALLQNNFNSFTKTDIEIIKDAIEKIPLGPRWHIEGVCPKCGEHFFFRLDYMYESFFARSFTSRAPKKRRKK